MKPLSKFDVLLYLTGGIETKELPRQIKNNALFEKTSDRKIKQLVRDLKKDGLILKSKGMLSPDARADNILAFLLWCKKDSVDYEAPLKNRNEIVFRKIFEGEAGIANKSGLSRQTAAKAIKELEQAGFADIIKKKPMIIKAKYTDRTIFFSNIFKYNFGNFQGLLKLEKIEKDSASLREHLIKLHVYSTTVTEGNTATEKDVERVLQNLGTNLSPREVMEITNAKHAVDELYRTYKSEDLSVELIKKLHKLVMANLAEKPGEFAYVRKRIIGSPVKLPDSKIEIDTAVSATINFYENYRNKMNPLALASLVHFLFVSIHPFIDGNGRVARLLHSFVLLKAGMPLFAFDPNYRNLYFDLLDRGRAGSVEDFVQFCIEKHKELIEKL